MSNELGTFLMLCTLMLFSGLHWELISCNVTQQANLHRPLQAQRVNCRGLPLCTMFGQVLFVANRQFFVLLHFMTSLGKEMRANTKSYYLTFGEGGRGVQHLPEIL